MSFPTLVRRNLLWAGLVAGALGDIGLQLANRTELGNVGLRPYFDNQKPAVAVARASALTGFWSGLFQFVAPEAGLPAFLLYAAGLDVLYRTYHASLGFPDLADYYAHSSFLQTVAFNVAAGWIVWTVGTFY
jgi:hypothetical protein